MQRLLVSTFSAVVAVLATSASVPTPSLCPSGAAHGVWQMPPTPQGTGQMTGLLTFGTGTAVVYSISANLIDVPSPCLSCVEGEIVGTLDDLGPGPDLVVHGRYIGSFFTGVGTFQLEVLSPSGAHRVGRITGTFDDTPITPGPGTFDGRWRVCP